MPVTPYVVGQWVRAEKFYGRRELLEEILDGHRNGLWLLGTRRIGKTSILKQLEHLTANGDPNRFFPLFWDFQGSEEPDDLHESFGESLLDAVDRLEALGIPLEAIEGEDLFASLSRLRRELRLRDRSLLLLGDEVEELVTISSKNPQFLRRLRRALQSSENIRTVLASTIRLWDLAFEETATSPFLHGFTPPLFVRGLSDEAARSLIRQSQLPDGSQPQLDDGQVESIRCRCNNHPYLLQLLCERSWELGDLEQAIEELATDQMVSYFFGVDFQMLSGMEKGILLFIGECNAASSERIQERLALESGALRGSLHRLEQLGFIGRNAQGEYGLPNYFFRRWFSEQSRDALIDASAQPTLRTPPLYGSAAGEPRQRIDQRYELIERLGSGASGEVYRAHDTLLRSEIAIKLLHREYGADEEAGERVRREVLLARDLTHPNILKVFHLGEDRGRMYVTMEYLEGSDLAAVLSREGPLTIPRVLDLAAQLAAALAAAHHRGVLHRDIKPSNILLDSEGKPRLTDFGLARPLAGPGITQDGAFLGTPAYASPEQVRGEPLDQRSDLYSLGVVLFEMVTGRRPFAGRSAFAALATKLREPPPAPRELRPEVPKALSELILRCLAKDPGERLRSATALGEALAAMRLD